MNPARLKLGDACEFIRGVTFPSGEGENKPFPGAIACLTTSGVQREVAWESRRFIPRARVGKDAQLLRSGDILISTANSKELVGKSCLVHRTPFDCTFGAFVTGARPKNSVVPSYLAYWMTTPEFLGWCYRRSTNTTNISNLRVSELEELEFFLPPLSEQQRIVRQLEQADRLRRTRRYALELSDSFLPAAFLELFGDPSTNWNGFPRVSIDTACKKIIDYRGRTPEYSESGIPHVTAACIKDREIRWHEAKFVSEQTFVEYMTRGFPQYGDVLLTTEAPLGETAVIRTRARFSLAQRLILLRPSSQLMPDYLCHLLGHEGFRSELLRFATGSTVKGISSENLQSIPLPIPPLPLQQKFATLVARHVHLRAIQREALRQAEHLFQTLLHSAFTEGMSC